jgi:hypothetical protein
VAAGPPAPAADVKRRWLAAGAVVVLGLAWGAVALADPDAAPMAVAAHVVSPATIRVVADGNMACDPADPHFHARSAAAGDNCRAVDVSTVAVGLKPALLLGLGDYQFEQATTDKYQAAYGPSWGRLRAKTVPTYGNQEYKDSGAETFLGYFGALVVNPAGYWSQDAGAWHLVILNSNCESVAGGCATGSAQQQWLSADLKANRKKCVLAIWHHPRWSSGIAGPDVKVQDLYRTLYNHRVPLLLSAHEADYERFGPLDPQGKTADHGVRQFVVGTGGQAHYVPDPAETARRSPATQPADQFADYTHHGVLELNLAENGWTFKYHALTDAGATPAARVVDQGSGRCS